MSKIITDDCFKSFINNYFGKDDFSNWGGATVTNALNVLQRGLQNSPNLISKGIFIGNYNSVGETGGLPEGNSVVWVNAANCTGTLPDVNVRYFQLVTITNDNIFQIALVYDRDNRQPRLSFRYYINNVWTPWGYANKQYYYTLDQLGLDANCDINQLLPKIPEGATFECWVPEGKLKNEFNENVHLGGAWFYLKIDRMGATWKLYVHPYEKSYYYMNTYTTTNNLGWDTCWYKFSGTAVI